MIKPTLADIASKIVAKSQNLRNSLVCYVRVAPLAGCLAVSLVLGSAAPAFRGSAEAFAWAASAVVGGAACRPAGSATGMGFGLESPTTNLYASCPILSNSILSDKTQKCAALVSHGEVAPKTLVGDYLRMQVDQLSSTLLLLNTSLHFFNANTSTVLHKLNCIRA